MADENLVIDIAGDDTAESVVVNKGATAPVVEKVKEPAVEDLKSQFAALQKTQEQTDQARIQAEQRARDAAQEAARARDEAAKARTETVESNINSVSSAMEAAQALAEAAENEYAAAMDAGDHKGAAKAQRKMADASYRIGRLEEGKADLEARKAEPAQTRQEPTRAVPVEADPVERALANVTPRTAAWLREHKEFVTDPKLNKKANAAHASAIAEDYIPDTDAYFDFCERFLGIKEEPAARTEQRQQPTTRTRTAMPAAPVSREGGSSNGSGGQAVTLTPGEQRAATDGSVVHNWDDPNGKFKKGDPVGLKEYARRKSAMQAEGRYANTYTDQ